MDTRFWGPSGWKLLHSIAGDYPENPDEYDKNNYKIFFETLPHILPCIYCRNSLTDYYSQFPIDKSLDKRKNLDRWLYNIHNLVNDKLRRQRLLKTPDPSFSKSISQYNSASCDEGWDFLYAIALNYPEVSKLITSSQRQNYLIFFSYLPKVLPNKKLAKRLNNFIKQYPVNYFIKDRDLLSKWLYSLEKTSTDCKSCFSKRCRQIERYRAGCKGKGDKKPTCRRNRTS